MMYKVEYFLPKDLWLPDLFDFRNTLTLQFPCLTFVFLNWHICLYKIKNKKVLVEIYVVILKQENSIKFETNLKIRIVQY